MRVLCRKPIQMKYKRKNFVDVCSVRRKKDGKTIFYALKRGLRIDTPLLSCDWSNESCENE